MHIDTSSTRGAFAALVAGGASCADVASTAREMWQRIDASLSPIIGSRGVAALYRRTVHLLKRDHPSLEALDLEVSSIDEFSELQRTSACLTSDGAVELNAAMLDTFRDLLAKLVGGSLADRLLQPAWEHLERTTATQGPRP